MDDETDVEFDLPEGTRLPDELVGDPPRDVPDAISDGSLAKKPFRSFTIGLSLAGVLISLSAVPFVEILSLYILPLGCLGWIGLAVGGLSLLSLVFRGEYEAAKAYVVDGHAAHAQVKILAKVPKLVMNGQTTHYAIDAVIAVVDPDTGEPVLRGVQSKDISSGMKDKIHARFRVGDFVPVVWMPNKFDETLQVYDFLELTTDASLDRTAATSPLWQIILGIIAIAALFCALFWNVYALGRYEPLEFEYGQDGAISLGIGACVGVLCLAGVLWYQRTLRQRLREKNETALQTGDAIELEANVGLLSKWFFSIVIAAGAILMCSLTSMMWAWTANAVFDKSQPREELVQVNDMIMVTHSFIFREYKLEYELGEEEHSLLTTPEHLARIEVPFAVARVRSGAFGWPWVESIEPVRLQGNEAGIAR